VKAKKEVVTSKSKLKNAEGPSGKKKKIDG
jgi:hypothetical protein